MSAMLRVTHKTIGAEVRRGTYDVVLDGKRVGSVEPIFLLSFVVPGLALSLHRERGVVP